MTAHRDKDIGGYHYRGYYFCKPHGCQNWNVYNVSDREIAFGFPVCHPESFKDCKESIDNMEDNIYENDI